MGWAHVIPHFTTFLAELELTTPQHEDVLNKVHRIGSSLHEKYYQGQYNGSNVIIVGSYGKGTTIHPSSDVDMIFVLPVTEFERINNRLGNVQSQLLQEVKAKLLSTYPRTNLSADGQVIVAPFTTISVDIVPAFRCQDGTYLTCHTPNGGSWRPSNPHAEAQAISNVDSVCQGKATHLIKMLKAWRRNCNVPLKSLVLEIAACEFLGQWAHRQNSIFWYDWMIRDFFLFFLNFRNGSATIPGLQETIYLGEQWVSRCVSAYDRAVKACEYEYSDFQISAAEEWQKIFGMQFKRIY